MMVPIQVIRWYRMQCYDGTDSCATVVPIRRYCQVQKLYETIADSEGELKNLNIVMMKDMKIKYNLFFENQEMGKEEAEAENVNADINFCDEQLVKDLVDRRVAAEKIAAKWVIGFVKSRLNDAENASLFEANGVDEISDNSLILPINVSYGSGYIMINSEVFD